MRLSIKSKLQKQIASNYWYINAINGYEFQNFFRLGIKSAAYLYTEICITFLPFSFLNMDGRFENGIRRYLPKKWYLSRFQIKFKMSISSTVKIKFKKYRFVYILTSQFSHLSRQAGRAVPSPVGFSSAFPTAQWLRWKRLTAEDSVILVWAVSVDLRVFCIIVI